MKKLCGLILIMAIFFSITSSAFASVDEHPLRSMQKPIIYVEK